MIRALGQSGAVGGAGGGTPLSKASAMPKNLVNQIVNLTPLPPNDCAQFWNGMQSSASDPTRVVAELVNKAVETERARANALSVSASASAGSRTAATAAAAAAEADRTLWLVVYTLRFIDVFYAVDTSDKNLRKAVTAYEALRAEHRAVTATAVECDQLIRFMARPIQDKLAAMNASIVMECGFVHSINAALVSSGGQRDLTFSVLRDNSFVHLRVLAQLTRGRDGARAVFSEVVRQLAAQVALIRAQPQIANFAVGNVMALLHVLHEALCVYPCADMPLLREALIAVRAFVGWPVPYGPHAQRVADAVLAELAVPGANVRARILSENPLLTPFGAEQADKYGVQGVDWARNHRVVTVVHNPAVPRAVTLRKMMGRFPPRTPAYLSELHNAREEILVSAFETSLVNANPTAWHSALVSALRNKHSSDVNDWFDRVMVALGLHLDPIALLLQPKRVDDKELMAVLREISPALVEGTQPSPAINQPLPKFAVPVGDASAANAAAGSRPDDSGGGGNEEEDEFGDSSNERGGGGAGGAGGGGGSPISTKTSLGMSGAGMGVALAPASAPGSAAFWTHTVPRVPQLVFDFLELATVGDSSDGITSRGTKGRRGRTEFGASLWSGSVGGGGAGSVGLDDFPPPPVVGGGGGGGGGAGGGGGKRSLVAGRRASKRAPAPKAHRNSVAIPGMDVFGGDGSPFDEAFTASAGFHKCPQRYVQYPFDYEELLRDARAVLPPDQTDGEPLEKARALGRGKGVLRRVLLGGKDVMHRAVTTYVALRAMEPELCAAIDFRFYVVPLGRNDLAAFIAQRDGWYRRHVYVPFHGPLMLLPLVKYATGDAVDLEMLDLASGWNASGADRGDAEEFGGGANRGTPPKTSGASRGGAMYDFAGGGLDPDEGVKSVVESGGAEDDPISGGGGSSSNRRTQTGAGGNNTASVASTTGGVGPHSPHDNDDAAHDGGGRAHRFDANPVRMLRHLLADYVRSAESAYPVHIYDCECWESPDAIETERGPDLTIPFCTRVEFGLGAAVAEHTGTEDFATNFVGEATPDGLGPEASFTEVLLDKSFVKAVSGTAPALKVVTPELNVCMFRMDVDGNLHAGQARDVMELADASYLSLAIASVPRFTLPLTSENNQVAVESVEPPSSSANPSFPWLEVQSVVARSSVADLVKKKDKRERDVELIKEHLRLDARTHHVGLVDVRASNASRIPFMVAVDGKCFGPYYRVRARGTTALSTSGGQAMFARAPPLYFPVMTFTPLESAGVDGQSSVASASASSSASASASSPLRKQAFFAHVGSRAAKTSVAGLMSEPPVI